MSSNTSFIEQLSGSASSAAVESGFHTNAQAWTAPVIIILAGVIMIFILISLLLSTFILIKQKAKPYQTLRVFGILSILGLSTLLVIVGYSIEQINGVVALFSAVAGYLLGKEPPNSHISEEEKQTSPPSVDNKKNE